MALVTTEAARRHLKLPPGLLGDDDLALKLEAASDIVLASVTDPPDVAWTETTAPAAVRLAVLLQLADFWAHRGDERSTAAPAELCGEAAALLRAAGYRDPVLA
jgi:hypothetical protein